VFARPIFWPWFAGLIFLVAGLFSVRKELTKVSWLEKLIVLGPVFLAASLAAFGAEHLSGPRSLMQVVPTWMPGRLFWAYFVGVALIAAAVSIVVKMQVRLSATLSGVMFLLFVAMIHLPRVIASPKDRFSWAVVFREVAFAGGAWALAGGSLVGISRFMAAITVLFYAVEHLLHPEFAPGVPLSLMTPAWVPFAVVWGYLAGIILLAGSMSMLAGIKSRIGAAATALVMLLLTVFLYLPIFLTAGQASLLVGLNYVTDTLLFAGTLLCVAAALPAGGRPFGIAH
jgi:uncharacterized membrane protein